MFFFLRDDTHGIFNKILHYQVGDINFPKLFNKLLLSLDINTLANHCCTVIEIIKSQAMFFDIIISTRRKALYKHIFQKVDKDRDNAITVKVG